MVGNIGCMHAETWISKNLKDWKLACSFGKEWAIMVVCGNAQTFSIASNSQRKMGAYQYQPGAPNGGSGTQYFRRF